MSADPETAHYLNHKLFNPDCPFCVESLMRKGGGTWPPADHQTAPRKRCPRCRLTLPAARLNCMESMCPVPRPATGERVDAEAAPPRATEPLCPLCSRPAREHRRIPAPGQPDCDRLLCPRATLASSPRVDGPAGAPMTGPFPEDFAAAYAVLPRGYTIVSVDTVREMARLRAAPSEAHRGCFCPHCNPPLEGEAGHVAASPEIGALDGPVTRAELLSVLDRLSGTHAAAANAARALRDLWGARHER